MPTTLRLTSYQRQVTERLLGLADVATIDELAARAVAHERARAPDPRWSAPRPWGDRPAPAPGDARLDAVLPAARGVALRLHAGQRLRIDQLQDGQGVDLHAWASDGRGFSAARTRATHGIHPTVGASLWSTPPELRLLTIVTDTAPGHDLCFPPCSEREYAEHAGIGGHLGCTELHTGTGGPTGDDVLNLWLPSDVASDGRLRSWPASCRAGDRIELVAEVDLAVSLTTCPDDLFGTSQYEPKPVRVIVSGGPRRAVDTSVWPADPPASALADHVIKAELNAADLRRVDEIAAGGWLGGDRPAVLRALIFRLHEALAQARQ
jgi:uncharacterized protein